MKNRSCVLKEAELTDGTQVYLLIIPNGKGAQRISFRKVDSAAPDTGLAGAHFDLYSSDSDANISLKGRTLLQEGLVSDKDGMLTSASGQTEFELPAGSYELVETKAPDGYNLLTRPVKLQVNAAGLTYDDGFGLSQEGKGVNGSAEEGFVLLISNSSGVEIPSTGGQGTTWIYLLGTVLLLGCGIMLIARRKIRN